MATEGKILIDYLLHSERLPFDSFDPIKEICPDCNSTIYRARLMHGDEDEAGSWVEYRFCCCLGVLVYRDEIRTDRVTPCRVDEQGEFKLREFFKGLEIKVAA